MSATGKCRYLNDTGRTEIGKYLIKGGDEAFD